MPLRLTARSLRAAEDAAGEMWSCGLACDAAEDSAPRELLGSSACWRVPAQSGPRRRRSTVSRTRLGARVVLQVVHPVEETRTLTTLTPKLIIDVTTKTGLIGCSRPLQTS